MSQLVSVRSNQDFGLDYATGKLIPQTEIIVLIQKPAYKVKGEKIIREAQVSELRFKCGSEGLSHLIGQLEAAQRTVIHFEKMAGSLNEIIVNSKRPEGEPVK